MKFKTEQNSL